MCCCDAAGARERWVILSSMEGDGYLDCMFANYRIISYTASIDRQKGW